MTTAAFTYLASFFWQDALLREPERLASFTYRDEAAGGNLGPIPYPDLLDYRRHGRDAAEVVGWRIFGVPVSIEGGQTHWSWGQAVSDGYFSTLGVEMAAGRPLGPGDHTPGSQRSVVIGDRFWARHFGRSDDALGQTLDVAGQTYTIVGATPRGFIGTGVPADLYTSLVHAYDVMPEVRFDDRARGTIFSVARLAPGVALEAAESRFGALADALDRDWPQEDATRRPYLLPIAGISRRTLRAADGASTDYFRRSVLLLGAAGLLLLLSCANVANLVVARNLGRRRELAIRSALGATRARLAASLATEGLWVVGLAAVLGIMFSRVLVTMMKGYFSNPVDLGHWFEGADFMTFDGRIAGFATGAAVASALLVNLWPALRSSRAPATAMSGRSGALRSSTRGRRGLVAFQVAMSAVLLTGSALLMRSLANVRATDPGFDAEDLVVASFALDISNLGAASGREAYREMEDRVRALPDVETAGLTAFIPLGGGGITKVQGEDRTETVDAAYNLVTPGFFETLRLPLLAGRPLDRERLDAAPGAVVSAGLAEKLWPAADPIDRSVRLRVMSGEEADYRVVGVAADARLMGLRSEPRPTVYLSFDQVFRQRMSLVARSRIPPAALLPGLRKVLERAHPRMALIQAATFDDHVERSLSDRRFDSSMATIIASLALLLAASGIASLLTYLVRARRRELAVRMAIGALPRDVLASVVGEAGAMIGVGALVGAVAAGGLARLLRGLLFGVGPLDGVSFTLAGVLLISVGLLAALGPALRASRIAPSEALREE